MHDDVFYISSMLLLALSDIIETALQVHQIKVGVGLPESQVKTNLRLQREELKSTEMVSMDSVRFRHP